MATKEDLDSYFTKFSEENEHINRTNFKTILQRLGNNPAENEIDAVFAQYDEDKDQVLSRVEFDNWIQKMMETPTEVKQAIKDAFQTIAKDFDRMEIEKLIEFLQSHGQEKLNEEDAKCMRQELVAIDTNKDNTIDAEELSIYLMGGTTSENVQGSEQTEQDGQSQEHTDDQNQEPTEQNEEHTEEQSGEQTEEQTEEQNQEEQTEEQGQEEQTEEQGQVETEEQNQEQTQGQTEEQPEGQTEGQTQEQDGEQTETPGDEQTEDNTEQKENDDTQQTQKTDEA